MKHVLAICAIVTAVISQAATDKTYNSVKYSSNGPILLGEWNRQFSKAKKYAEDNDTPMVCFWGNNGCSVCEGVENSMGKDSKFAQWMKSGFASNLVMAFNIGTGSADDTAAESFCHQDGEYPFLTIYWPRHDASGKLVTSKKKYNLGSDTASGIIKKVESVLNGWGYVAYSGGSFALGTPSDGNRYEIEDNTSAVTIGVDLVRDAASVQKAAAETLVLTAQGKEISTTPVVWAVGDEKKTVNVTIPAGTLKITNEAVTLKLTDGKSHEETCPVVLVKAENSAANPMSFLEPAEFGKWTMNIDGAKELVAKEGTYTIVSIQGSQWCPDCANTDRNFLDVKNEGGENRFQAWAEARKIALVSLDIPNFTGPAVTSFSSPCLLSRKAAESTLAREKEYPASGADEKLTKPLVRSGLGYQTRKGISEEQAAKQLKIFHDLAVLNTDKGGFHRPEDTNLNRTGVPIFVLLRKDGSVAARFTDFASVSPMKADRANFEKYLKRFEEMMDIAGGTSVDDASEVWNNRASAKSPAIDANGGEGSGRLSAVDTIDSWRLDKFTGNGKVSVTVSSDGGNVATNVEVSLWTVDSTGAVAIVKGTEKKQSLAKPLEQAWTFDDIDGSAYVQIKATGSFSVAAPEKSFAGYKVRSSLVLVPQESRATGAAPTGSDKVKMQLVEGVVYRIEGLGDNASKLEPLSQEPGNVLFKSKAKGDVELECASDGGVVTYQKWVPGKVGFEPAPVTTPAKKTTKKATTVTRKENESVEVGIRRIEGLSGDVKVKVSVNVDETDFYYDYAWDQTNKKDPRFSVDGVTGEAVNTWTKIVDWPDGKSLDECVDSIEIAPYGDRQNIYYGDGKVMLSLEIVDQTTAGDMTNKIDNATFVINFVERQKPSAGKVAFLGTDRIWAKSKTVYARASDTVKIDVGRLEAMDGNVQAKVKSSVSSVTLGGACAADQVISWDNHEGAVKKLEVSDLPAGKTVKLTLSAVTKGLKTLSSSNAVSIVTVADDAPAFEQAAYESRTLYRYAEVREKFSVTGTVGDDMSFSKVSGSLPSGLKVSWDAESKSMLVSGVPTDNVKVGKTYTAVYQVKEKRPKSEGSSKKVTVDGLVASVTFRVVDPAVEGTGAGGEGAINAACAKSRTFTDLQVICPRDDGEGADLWGTLQLTLPPTGKASAKFLCASGTVSFAAKSWQCVDWEDPTTRTCLLTCSKKGFKDWTLSVRALANGSISAELDAPGIGSATVTHKGVLWSKTHPAKDCVGYYTVTLADNVVSDSYEDITGTGSDRATRGSGYVALTMSSSSQYNAGTMKWAGVLPNGTSFSGSTVLTEVSDELVHLPFIKSLSSGKDFVSGVLAITRGAKDREGKECWETVQEAFVQTAEGEMTVLSKWVRSEKSKVAAVNAKGDFAVRFRPYGGIYDISTHDLGCCCTHEEGRGTDEMRLKVELPVGGSDYYDAFGEVEPIDLKISATKITRKDSKGGANKVSLSFDKKTGVVSGKFNLKCIRDGQLKTLTAAYKGIVELGFGSSCGCGTSKPFVSGYWTFDDKFTYESGTKTKTQAVKRGGLFTIDVNTLAE